MAKGMIARRHGKIINISSIGGRKGAAGRSAYRVTKAGLISFTESLAAEVKRYGIDVNAICPGPFLTEMNVPIADTEEAKNFIVGATALALYYVPAAHGLLARTGPVASGPTATASGAWSPEGPS